MKYKLLLAFLSLTLITGAAYAKKPPKTPDRPQIVWVDAAGTYLGETQYQQTSVNAFFMLDIGGELFELIAERSNLITEGFISYTLPNCEGTAYMRISSSPRPLVQYGDSLVTLYTNHDIGYRDDLIYVPSNEDTDIVVGVELVSEYDSEQPGYCWNYNFGTTTLESRMGLVKDTIDISSMYVPPFHIELK